MSFNIAIDGPAGAGKSTIAKKIAAKKGYIYVDTGAMYRAMALYLLREHVDPSQSEEIDKKCQDADITIAYENGEQVVYLNGENVNGYIRTEEVGNHGVCQQPQSQSAEETGGITAETGGRHGCGHGWQGYRYLCTAGCPGQSVSDSGQQCACSSRLS